MPQYSSARFGPLLATLLAAVPCLAQAQAIVPEGHVGFALAEAIAAQGCVLHQDDVNEVLEAAGLVTPQFPQMAVPLMQDGYLRPSGEGTLTLINWGLCTDQVGGADDADGDDTEGEDATVQPDSENSVPATE